MIIEFKVSNFRSVREQQTLSLVASNSDRELFDDCVIEKPLPGLKDVKFLRGAAIYGANASGKSNVFLAMSFVKDFVGLSATVLQPGAAIPVVPFKLDRESREKPSSFEITFVVEGSRYVFGFSVSSERIVEEYLIAYPKGLPQHWYHRSYDEGTHGYDWGKTSAAFKLDPSIREKTKENSLFLSVAAQFNHPQLAPLYLWFRKGLRVLSLGTEAFVSPAYTIETLKTEQKRGRILSMLQSADIGVSDLTEKEKDMSPQEIRKQIAPFLIDEALVSDKTGMLSRVSEVKLLHQAEGDVRVPLDLATEESAGTRRFFTLAGPWTDVLDNGYTLVIDEIETSLHPLLVKALLKLVFSSKTNPSGAQLIFTTHNPVLLDLGLIRRDQVWFTEKSPQGSTTLYPLTDYKPRKDEALARGYLAGRYGAVPIIPDGLRP